MLKPSMCIKTKLESCGLQLQLHFTIFHLWAKTLHLCRTKAHEAGGAGGQRRRRDQVQEGTVALSHLWQGEKRLIAESQKSRCPQELEWRVCVCVHRCSPAGATWTSICWLTVIRSTPVRSAAASSSAWTSFGITFTFTSRWGGEEGRLLRSYQLLQNSQPSQTCKKTFSLLAHTLLVPCAPSYYGCFLFLKMSDALPVSLAAPRHQHLCHINSRVDCFLFCLYTRIRNQFWQNPGFAREKYADEFKFCRNMAWGCADSTLRVLLITRCSVPSFPGY